MSDQLFQPHGRGVRNEGSSRDPWGGERQRDRNNRCLQEQISMWHWASNAGGSARAVAVLPPQ